MTLELPDDGLQILPWLEALQSRLETVERQLADVQDLETERVRLKEAIASLMALRSPRDADTPALGRLSDRLASLGMTLGAAPESPSEAAITVLRLAGQPMHLRQIIGMMQAQGWYRDRDYESLRGSIASTFNLRDKAGDTVTKVGPSEYGLREWYFPSSDRTSGAY